MSTRKTSGRPSGDSTPAADAGDSSGGTAVATAPTPTAPVPTSKLDNARKELRRLNQVYLSTIEKGDAQKNAARAELDKISNAVDLQVMETRRAMQAQQAVVAQIEAQEAAAK